MEGDAAGENPTGLRSSPAPTFGQFTCLYAPEGGTPGTTEGTGGGERLPEWAEEGENKFSGSGLELPADLEPIPIPLRSEWASAIRGVTELTISKIKKACEGLFKIEGNPAAGCAGAWEVGVRPLRVS